MEETHIFFGLVNENNDKNKYDVYKKTTTTQSQTSDLGHAIVERGGDEEVCLLMRNFTLNSGVIEQNNIQAS